MGSWQPTRWVVSLSFLAAACSFRDIDQYGTGGRGGSTTGGSSNGGSVASGGSWATGGAPGGAAGAPSGGGGTGNLPQDCSSCGASSCACVPQAPTGFVPAVYVESTSSTPAACPTGYGSAIVVGKTAKDTGCGACTCGAPTTSSRCHPEFFDDAACSNFAYGQGILDETGACEIGSTGGSRGFSIVPEIVCAKGTGQPNPPVFETYATICSLESASAPCGQGTCVAASAPPFAQAPCILSTTGGICPADYPVMHTYAIDFTDTRSCSCDCTGQGCTGGSIQFYAQSGCSGGSTSKTYQSCYYGPIASFKVAQVGTPMTCVAGVASVTGAVTGKGQRVLCCMQ